MAAVPHSDAAYEEASTRAPIWDAEEALARAEEAIDALRQAVTPGAAIWDFETATVRDFVGVKPDGGRCRLGSFTHRASPSKGITSANYRLCNRADCQNCSPTWVKLALRKSFHVWDGKPLYRATFDSQTEFRNSQRGKRLREYGPFLRVDIGYTGMQRVYFVSGVPPAAGDGEPVLDPATEVLESLLAVPAYANNKRRITTPRLPKPDPGDADPADAKPSVHKERSAPHWVTQDEADEILPGHAIEPNDVGQINGRVLLNKLREALHGREVAQTMPYWRSKDFASWTLTDLRPEEVEAEWDAGAPLHEIAVRNRRERAEAKREAARVADMFAGSSF